MLANRLFRTAESQRIPVGDNKRKATLDGGVSRPYVPRTNFKGPLKSGWRIMKVVNSLKSMKDRHKECRIVRRKGRLYVINKLNPRFKARQG